MTHTKAQFKAKCVLRNLNPRQPNPVVATNTIVAMAKSARPITRTGKKKAGIYLEEPDSSRDPVSKRPRGRPCKRPHKEKDSFPQRSETTAPAPAKKRGNPNWTKKADKGPKNPTHQWTCEEDTPLPNTPVPTKKKKGKQQQESQHHSRNLQHDENESPGKQGRTSSTNIPNETLDSLIQLLENQNEQIAQQNMLMLDQIGQMSDIKKLLIGFKGFFDQATEVNIRYNRQAPTNTTHATDQPYAGTSMEHPATNTNHGIDPGLSENRFNQSFNWNLSDDLG